MSNLKQLRKENGYTQAQLAGLLGISRESYNAMERNDAMPNLAVADCIAHVFNVTLYDVWPELSSAVDYEYVKKSVYLDGKDAAMSAIWKTADAFCH